MDWKFQSALPGIVWPAVPAPERAAVLGLLFQLEQSQWLSAESLLQQQLRQLERVLRHAHATVPYYRERWGGAYDRDAPLTAARFAALPLLGRRDLQERFEALKSGEIPAAHGSVAESRTSGSTGVSVRVLHTALTGLFWETITLREHAWHRRDLLGKLAAIRQTFVEGESDEWGKATRGLVATGPSVVSGVRRDTPFQLDWLERHRPDYLMTYPSILRELVQGSLERGTRPQRLREVRTFGELLTPALRELCRQAWGVPVTDVYSSDEVGYIALQCPDSEHYHVQSEALLVEILDDLGRPCAAGQTGRVVVTSLHNFAMPLIRYDIGDYAEQGGPCSCGRGLPVLRRIVGRVRNMLITPTGERYWPLLGSRKYNDIAPIVQHQFVQKEVDLIEVRLVVAAALTGDQEQGLRKLVLAELPPGFRLRFVYCDRIPRSAGGKFEDFMSEIAAASTAMRA